MGKRYLSLNTKQKISWFEKNLLLNLANQSDFNVNFPLNNLNFITSDKYPSLFKKAIKFIT